MKDGYYKPRKTLIPKEDLKKQPAKKVETPPIKPKQKNNNNPNNNNPPSLNITGGYSKRVTYPAKAVSKEVAYPAKATPKEVIPQNPGLQKGGGKIRGYIKPNVVSYNPMRKIVWGLLVVVAIAVIFVVLIFTNTLKINGVELEKQNLEMKISNVQIEKGSVDLKMDINTKKEELVGVKIIVDSGIDSEIFKIDLTPEEIEKGEIHLDLINVDGDKITKILVSPILNTKKEKGVVGSVEESYIPKREDFVTKRGVIDNEPQDTYYPFNGLPFQNQTQNKTKLNETNNNQTQNQSNLNQTLNNETYNNLNGSDYNNSIDNQTQFNESLCTENDLLVCYQETVYQYNSCLNAWETKDECTSEELCMTNRCIPREEIIPKCGNGILEVGEYCEKGKLIGETCESFGYKSGTLTCNSRCAFDLRECLEQEHSCTPNCQNKECGSDECGGSCGDCSLEETCNESNICVLELINNPCWIIENNQCEPGGDEVTCGGDVIYSSEGECQENLFPSECLPDELGNSPLCIKIEENSQGYDDIVQGASTCNYCSNDKIGEVIAFGSGYYCKCPTHSNI